MYWSLQGKKVYFLEYVYDKEKKRSKPKTVLSQYLPLQISELPSEILDKLTPEQKLNLESWLNEANRLEIQDSIRIVSEKLSYLGQKARSGELTELDRAELGRIVIQFLEDIK